MIRSAKTIAGTAPVAVALVLFACSSVAVPAAPAAVDAKAIFEMMKKLAGDWSGTALSPGGDAVSVSYRVTAAGNTVMETLAPGTDHEMVTMYHLDGKNLVMTHYCAAGNQPHLKLNAEKSSATELVFDFAGGTNLDPAKDVHIHGLVLRMKSDNQLEADWSSYKDGKPAEGMKYVVNRKK